jgi:5'-3' exonuclease
VKYLFIDGNNLGVRCSFSNQGLSIDFIDYSKDYNPDDVLDVNQKFPTGAIHGFFKSLNYLKRAYPDRYICVAWDGKSKARVLESRDAVEKGIIPQEYKANRIDNKPEAVINFHRQRPVIMSALSLTNIPQVMKSDEEADDIIASFVEKLKGNDILILTNDHDYYQLLGEGVTILDGKGSVLDYDWFKKTYGIEPCQWVDVGALCGDSGDNIFGIPWVGETTAIREVAKYGTCEAVIQAYKIAYGDLKEKFPDLQGEEFNTFKGFKTADDKPKYPFVKPWMSYTGVAMAYESNKAKIPRNIAMSLLYESRVPLAKNLKMMRKHISLPDLPVDLGRDKVVEFVELCQRYKLNEIAAAASQICARQFVR